MQHKKVLVLGHGWLMWKERHVPRCAPMELDEWNILVQDAPQDCITFIDFDEEQEPDIVENIGNDWSSILMKQDKINYYDYVIDSTSHLATKYRRSCYFWNSVKKVLKEDGIFIGWKDSYNNTYNNDKKLDKKIRLNKNEIDNHVLQTYNNIIQNMISKQNFELYSSYKTDPN